MYALGNCLVQHIEYDLPKNLNDLICNHDTTLNTKSPSLFTVYRQMFKYYHRLFALILRYLFWFEGQGASAIISTRHLTAGAENLQDDDHRKHVSLLDSRKKSHTVGTICALLCLCFPLARSIVTKVSALKITFKSTCHLLKLKLLPGLSPIS